MQAKIRKARMLKRQQQFVDKLAGIMKLVAQFGGNRKKKVCLRNPIIRSLYSSFRPFHPFACPSTLSTRLTDRLSTCLATHILLLICWEPVTQSVRLTSLSFYPLAHRRTTFLPARPTFVRPPVHHSSNRSSTCRPALSSRIFSHN